MTFIWCTNTGFGNNSKVQFTWRVYDWQMLFIFKVPVVSWFDDVEDAELLNLLPVFEELSQADDIYTRLDQLRGH